MEVINNRYIFPSIFSLKIKLLSYSIKYIEMIKKYGSCIFYIKYESSISAGGEVCKN